jgi:hypothetical protein
VPRTSVNAKVVADIPAGGRILSFFHSGPGLVWLLFGALLFFGLPLLDRLRDARGLEAEATADLRDQLEAVSARLADLQAEQERSRLTADETLGQLDQLTRLVTEALGQRPAAGHDVRRPEDAPADDADLRAPEAEAPQASAATQTSGASPGLEPAVPAVKIVPVLVPGRRVEATPEAVEPLGATEPGSAPGPEADDPGDPALEADTDGPPEVEAESAAEPSAPGQRTGTPATCGAAGTAASEPDRGAQEPGAAAHAPSTPISADEPTPDLDRAPSLQATIATRPRATDPVGALGAPLRREPVTMSISGPAQDVARVLGPVGVSPVAVSFARWDAPPSAGSAGAGGWAAPPATVRSGRFQRPGRLIAASLAQPSPAA